MSMQSMRSEASAGLVSGGQSRVPDTCSFGIYKGNRVAVRNIQCGPVTLTRANLLELKMVTGNGFTNWSEILMEHFREHCSINFNSTWQTHHPVAIIFVMRIHHNAIRLLAVYLWIYRDCAVSAIWARVLMQNNIDSYDCGIFHITDHSCSHCLLFFRCVIWITKTSIGLLASASSNPMYASWLNIAPKAA